MRALTVEEFGLVSGGDFNGILKETWGDLGADSPAPSGSQSSGSRPGLVLCVSAVAPNGAGGHACISSSGQVNVGLTAGTPGANATLVGTNNTTGLITGTSAAVNAGPLAVAAAPGTYAIGVNVGTPGASVNFAPSNPVGRGN